MADLNTGLSAPEVLEAFDRALHDYTNSQIDTMLAAKQAALTFDSIPTDGSTNPVRSDGIYDFVNSSVATNTANFIGTFNSVAELNGYSGTVTNNDYAFVISTDSAGNTVYNRYKYNGSAWVFEYALNNSSFTAAQWATIQSGLTTSDKTKLDGIEDGANKTVVDANISATSTNPVQNKAVNTALAAKQDAIADLTSIRSGAAAGATAVQQSAFEVDQQRQETEIGAVANAGAKNLLKITATSQTIKGVTFTVNDNQTVTVNGTNDGTGESTFVIVPNAQAITIPDGNYILSGCPTGGGIPYDLRWFQYSIGKSAYDNGAGVSVTKNGNTTTSNIAIVVKTGQTANNAVFSPMLRPASITDDTFVPYAKTNRELTVAEDEDRAALIAQVDGSEKNLFDIQHPSTTRGTEYNATSDGGVELTCSNAAWTQYIINDISVESGREYNFTLYVDAISGTDTFRAYVRDTNDSGNVLYDSGNISTSKTITRKIASSSGKIWVGVYLNNSATAKTASAKIRAMLCTSADYTISPAFVPYAPTNRELYETKANTSELHEILPNITSSTTIKDYVDSLSKGVYTAFIANVSNPSDSPINANCFVNIYVYSTNAAAVELIPIAYGELARTYTMRKILGTWREWYMVEGTVVS